MRYYLSLLLLLVTLPILSGCGTTPQDRAMRTPSGQAISDRLPDFGSQTPASGQAPLETTASGRHGVTPYYPSGTTGKPAATMDLPEIKVALLVPLSGDHAPLGQAMLNAAQLALFDIGAGNITLIPHDTATGAANAARNVLGEGAQIILGPLFAQDVKDVSPVARERNVPVIAFSTDWTAANDNTYIMGFLPFGQVTRVMDYAARNGVTQIYALIPQTAYGMAVNGSLRQELERRNMQLLESAVFANAALPQAVSKLSMSYATHQPHQHAVQNQALLLPLGGPQLAQAASILRQNNWNFGYVRLLGTGLWDDSPQAANSVPGGWYAAPDPRLRLAFNAKYRQTYGQIPPRLATLAYDATALAASLGNKGLRENGAPSYQREALTNPAGFSGIDGVFRFRSDHLAERGLAILELRTGGSVVIDPAPTRF